ncbi:MAG: hypothetical protein IPJ16_01980 [Bacteroidales bacterium]|nr:hypothetical protein [Bacteroidales bacterium]
MVFSIDFLALNFGKVDLPITKHIREYFFIDKLAHVMVFFFMNVSIYHLRKVNFRYEDRLYIKTRFSMIRITNSRKTAGRYFSRKR